MDAPPAPRKANLSNVRAVSGHQIPPDLASKILQDCENPHPSKLANQESMTGRPKKALRPSQSIGQKSSGREKILRLGNGSSKENEQNEESSSADSGYKQVKVY